MTSTNRLSLILVLLFTIVGCSASKHVVPAPDDYVAPGVPQACRYTYDGPLISPSYELLMKSLAEADLTNKCTADIYLCITIPSCECYTEFKRREDIPTKSMRCSYVENVVGSNCFLIQYLNEGEQ